MHFDFLQEQLMNASTTSTPKALLARRIISNTAMLVVAVVFVLVLWPSKWGGSTTLVVVAGNSMEPALSTDDIVWTRKASTYSVGDVVAFAIPNGPAKGRLVIHRIVGGDENGWELKGDNRAGVDRWNPTSSDITGREVTHVGGAEKVRWIARTLLSPFVWAAFVGAVAAVTVWRLIMDDPDSEHPGTEKSLAETS